MSMPDTPMDPEPMAVVSGWPRLSFIALCLCWLWLLGLPCLQQNEAMRFAEDAVLALMAAVILLAVHTAWCGGETVNAVLFTLAELLYCGSY
ncbi:MAG: hypothetical protein ACPGSM_22245 [Thiolinea sp.]